MADRRDYNERGEVLRRFYALPERDRLAVFAEIRDYLAEDLGDEEQADRMVALKVDALEALDRVAKDLRRAGELAAGKAPTARQFDVAARRMKLDWSSSRVARVFGRWRHATDAFLGAQTTEGAWRRRLRQVRGGRGRSHEGYVEGLRLWLAENPSGFTRADYDAFVDDANSDPARERPLARASAVVSGLGVPWHDAVRVARGDVALEAARAAHRRQLVRGLRDGDLVGADVVGALLGRSSQQMQYQLGQPAFPRPVARIGRARAWLLGDVKVYAASGEVPHRVDYEMQGRIIETAEIAERLGIKTKSLVVKVHQAAWHLVPEPAGQVATNYYWWRDEVEAWTASRAKRPR